nr:immunoglobulin heavy chain junction region [Macaca mulatta]
CARSSLVSYYYFEYFEFW